MPYGNPIPGTGRGCAACARAATERVDSDVVGRSAIAAWLVALLTVAAAAPAGAHDDGPRVRAAAIGPDGRCTGDPIDADRVIEGTFDASRQGSYVMVPFSVPRGQTALRVKYCFGQPTPSP